MKIKSKVFRRKAGKSKGSWIVRLQYADDTGRPKYIERTAATKTAVRDLRDSLVIEIQRSNGQFRTGEKMTFDDLADYCEKHYYTPAVYADGRKVSGVRSVASVRSAIAVLRDYFDRRPIRMIYRATLSEYKVHRLSSTSPKTGRRLSIATVNRELAALRRMLKVAHTEGWILRDPFVGAAVINVADEKPRERILTSPEERRLLAQCVTERKTIETTRYGKPLRMNVENSREHLRPIIVLALDTGMRRGELLKLSWSDIDFDRAVITVRATHTKTQRERIVPLTARAERELIALRGTLNSDRVFPFMDIKRSFNYVKEKAGLQDLRFHDLRHTAITRMIRGGISVSEAGKVAGHTQPGTTYRYINVDGTTLERVAAVLDQYGAVAEDNKSSFAEEASEMIN